MRRVEKMVKKYVFTKSQIFLSLIDLFLREWTRNIFFFFTPRASKNMI